MTGRHEQLIVVGFDGSDAADKALVRAAQLVGSDGRVVVVFAAPLLVPLGRSSDVDDSPHSAVRLLAEASSLLESLGVAYEAVQAPLEPADALIEIARGRGADTIVVGTRGRGRAARAALGSVSAAVLHHAPCDVLVVRPARLRTAEEAPADWPRTVLVGFDGSPWAKRALERAGALVRPSGVVHIVSVGVRSRLGRAVRRTEEHLDLEDASLLAGALGVAARTHVKFGDAAAAILETADEVDADLIAVGSRSRGPATRLILGSVSAAVAHQAEQDVLVVRRS